MGLEESLISLITGLVGASVGYTLAHRKSRMDELAKLRIEAYVDFIKATSHLVAARRLGRIADDVAELGGLNDAKARICICAPRSVVEEMERFWLGGGTLELEGEILAFTRMCRAMRESIGNDKLSHDMGLSEILFRLEPSKFSYQAARKKEEDATTS